MKAPGDSHFGKKHLKPLKTRHFLFLQGLMGPFFERVGEALLADGYKVSKISAFIASRVLADLIRKDTGKSMQKLLNILETNSTGSAF